MSSPTKPPAWRPVMWRTGASPARSRRRLEQQLPVVAATLARSVRSGATLAMALADAARSAEDPVSSELTTVVDSTRRGVSIVGALERWDRRSGSAQVELLVAAARLGQAHGGDLAAALDGAAVSLLDRIEVADEARALSAQAMTSAVALLALPPFGAVCFVLLDPRVGATLVRSAGGWACLVVGSLLDAAGAAVMVRMVRRATS